MHSSPSVVRPRVVVVTGASAGLGRAIVREFAEREPGVRLGLLARGTEGLAAARREVEASGGRALDLALDVADAAAVEAAAERIEQEFGPIDVWINNAMTSVFSPIRETTAEEFKRVTEVTYLGFVHGSLAALKRMLPRDEGTIVQVGSALSYRSIPLQAAYCAAKSAIRGFTDSLHCELHHDRSRVRVTTVQMPALNTTQFGWCKSRMPRKSQPVGPIYEPEVGARAVYWASRHPARRELWVGLSTAQAITGQKFIPGLLDRLLARVAWSGQQTDEPRDPHQPENLFAPVPGDAGAHGTFGDRARKHSAALWMAENRNGLAFAGLAMLGVAVFTALFGERRR